MKHGACGASWTRGNKKQIMTTIEQISSEYTRIVVHINYQLLHQSDIWRTMKPDSFGAATWPHPIVQRLLHSRLIL